MPLGKKKVRKIIKELEEVARVATLKSACFDSPGNYKKTVIEKNKLTEFIRDRVRLHHDTWVISPLLAIIRELQSYAEPQSRTAKAKKGR